MGRWAPTTAATWAGRRALVLTCSSSTRRTTSSIRPGPTASGIPELTLLLEAPQEAQELSTIDNLFKRYRAFGVGISADANAIRMTVVTLGEGSGDGVVLGFGRHSVPSLESPQ